MTRNEIKDIVKLAVTELDLRTTKGIGDLTAEFIRFQGIIPQLIADAIKDCRIYQGRRRRWNISTIIALAAVAIAGCSAFAAHWPF